MIFLLFISSREVSWRNNIKIKTITKTNLLLLKWWKVIQNNKGGLNKMHDLKSLLPSFSWQSICLISYDPTELVIECPPGKDVTP